MNEEERQGLNKINRELMEANTEYEEMVKKLAGIGLKIFELKKEIDEELDKKET